ncbi:MAG TPA: helix-turn-helix transcriptional regulator [Steroidobacteraceae bacterium]|jgi:PadR family transcriptional regulator PadR|nr:helix-turn-helix transcriptional regulator [Steroidobacteraceae bacterium]
MKHAPQLGQFEQTVLTAILRCGERAYGVPIHEAVEALSARSVSPGAVYATLDRLEDKALINSWLSDPTPERGGRARRYYRLERDGEVALRDSLIAARRLWEAVRAAGRKDLWSAMSIPVRP